TPSSLPVARPISVTQKATTSRSHGPKQITPSSLQPVVRPGSDASAWKEVNEESPVHDHPLTRRSLLLGAAAGVVTLAEGCAAGPAGSRQPTSPPTTSPAPTATTTTPIPVLTPRSPSPVPKPPNPVRAKANELGTVP